MLWGVHFQRCAEPVTHVLWQDADPDRCDLGAHLGGGDAFPAFAVLAVGDELLVGG